MSSEEIIILFELLNEIKVILQVIVYLLFVVIGAVVIYGFFDHWKEIVK